ncbi:MAG: 30S ribosomal protein S20 [Candidatus Omnitrophica bacterium]|nr:30S ribosomal protein S20 [Candidatus Omnitrophota bacterium]
MARKPSVMKRQRQEARRRTRNRMKKAAVKTAVKETKKAVLNQDEKSAELLKKACKSIDRAAAKGVIHKNAAARKKSRLAKFKNKYGVKTGSSK